MKLNVFEGARRIALALGVLWAVGCLAYAVVSKPHASATFAISGPGEQPVRAEQCADDDATEYTATKTRKAHDIDITLCFTARQAADGRLLVPYTTVMRVPDGSPAGIYLQGIPSGMSRADVVAKLKANGIKVGSIDSADMALPMKLQLAPPDDQEVPFWGYYLKLNTKYSAEVAKYTAEAKSRFIPSARDLELFEGLYSRALFEQWKSALEVLVGGLVLGWVLVAATGWVVRGFLGIPRGQDARSDASPHSQDAPRGPD